MRHEHDTTTGTKRVAAWLHDDDNRNLPVLLTLRIHREAECINDEPYGTRVEPIRTYDGDPNDFECEHCQRRFRRVVVAATEADRLRRVTARSFDGTNGLTDVHSLVTSALVAGCDCHTGYEHAQRGRHEQHAIGTQQRGEVVTLVWGEWEVAQTNADRERALSVDASPSRVAVPDEPVVLPPPDGVYRVTGRFQLDDKNPYREGAYPEDDLLDLRGGE